MNDMAMPTNRPQESEGGRANIYPLLRQTPLRKFVPEAKLRELEGFCERVTKAPGATLYRQGDPADRLFLVVNGSVELRARPPGRRVYRTVEVGSEGCTVGDESIVGEDQYLTSARIQQGAELLMLAGAKFEHLLTTRPELATGLLQCAGSCLIQMVRRSAILTQAPADVALELLLRELSQNEDNGVVHITHAQLAGLLHLSRETVSRMLGQMASHGQVRLSRGTIRLTG